MSKPFDGRQIKAISVYIVGKKVTLLKFKTMYRKGTSSLVLNDHILYLLIVIRHGCTNPTNDDFVVAMDADIILDAVRV